MSNEILDNYSDNLKDNSKSIILKILLVIFLSIVMLFIIEQLNYYIIENNIKIKGVNFNIQGLILLTLIIIVSLIISTYLNKLISKSSDIKVGIITGLFLITIEFLYKSISTILYYGNFMIEDVIRIMKVSLYFGLIGLIIGFLRIRKLRNKSILNFVVIIILLLALIGFLLNKYL